MREFHGLRRPHVLFPASQPPLREAERLAARGLGVVERVMRSEAGSQRGGLIYCKLFWDFCIVVCLFFSMNIDYF